MVGRSGGRSSVSSSLKFIIVRQIVIDFMARSGSCRNGRHDTTQEQQEHQPAPASRDGRDDDARDMAVEWGVVVPLIPIPMLLNIINL